MQLPEIAGIEKAADHVRRDSRCALLVKLVPRHFKTAIGAGQGSLKASVKKVVGFDHDHASTGRMAVDQPEELRGRFGPACHARSIGREVYTFNPPDEARALRGREL